MEWRIPFNKPFIAGKELYNIAQAVTFGQISGDGHFTQRCCQFLQDRFEIPAVLMTPSCTAALEMAAMLCDLGPGDEVILPSFTFVSTASAVVRQGARPIFVDIRPDTLNIDDALIEPAVTPRTKAIFPVHYAGVACEMDRILAIAESYNLNVVEDAAQGVNAFYHGRALGTLGHLGTYSFHETKNYICGEGGAICVNSPKMLQRAEIIRDKGTNRRQFFRGEVDKYTWVELGSSYIPSEISSAFLFAQLEMLENISERRRRIYDIYYERFEPLQRKGLIRRPYVPEGCQPSHHMFYILLPNERIRNELMAYLKERSILAVFHYLPLHSSPMGQKLGYAESELPVTEDVSRCLLRLPFYYDISETEQDEVIDHVTTFLNRTFLPSGRRDSVLVK